MAIARGLAVFIQRHFAAALPGDGVSTSATCNLASSAGAGHRYRHLFSFLRQRLRLR